MERGRYYFRTEVALPFAEAMERVKKALTHEGFGVMSEIDLSARLKERLGVDFHPYLILGACHPPSAWQVVQAEEQIGLLLPCNVVVQEGKQGGSVVSAIDPETAMAVVGNHALAPLAAEVGGRLSKVLERVEKG